jgi:hypothetical protein
MVTLFNMQVLKEVRNQLLRERAKQPVVCGYGLLPSFVLELFESTHVNSLLHIAIVFNELRLTSGVYTRCTATPSVAAPRRKKAEKEQIREPSNFMVGLYPAFAVLGQEDRGQAVYLARQHHPFMRPIQTRSASFVIANPGARMESSMETDTSSAT